MFFEEINFFLRENIWLILQKKKNGLMFECYIFSSKIKKVMNSVVWIPQNAR